LNGGRAKLTTEQLGFVGVSRDAPDIEISMVGIPTIERSDNDRWVPVTAHARVDEQLESLARRLDVAPGWYALAKAIVGDGNEP
jgi:hypothetical protein